MSDKKKAALIELVKKALDKDLTDLKSVILLKAVNKLLGYVSDDMMPKANVEYLALKKAAVQLNAKAKSITYLPGIVLEDNIPQRVWTYSPALTKKDEELKELKKAEQENGTAKSKLANSTQVFKVSIEDDGLTKVAGLDEL